jgi:outer membrane protein W
MTNKLMWPLAGALAVIAVGPSAQAQGTHFKVYAGPAYVASMSDSDVTLGAVSDTIKSEKNVGWNVGIEGRFNDWFGVEVDYVNANQDVTFGGSTIGDTTFSPLTATFDVHVVHTKVVDLYLGPSYSYVNWGDIHLNADGTTINGGSTIGTDSSKSWGVSLGIDIGFGKHFAFEAGAKYLNVDLTMNNGQTADVKPLVARLGLAARF